MVDWKKIIVGTLILLISASVIYISLPDNVKLRVDNDKSTFYVLNENNRWIVSGREYSSLFDGTSKMNRRVSGITTNILIDNISNTVIITRETPYIRGPIIIDTYYFDGNIDDVKLFPIYHKIEIINGSGYFYRYEVRDLTYDEITYKLTGETELYFGLNMKVELNPDYRWGRVYKKGIVKAQYNIPTDYEVFNMRLFDPPTQDNPILNSTLGTNLTSENITCYNQSTEGDMVYNIIEWFKDGVAIMDLNMPMDIDARDYTSNNHSFTVTGVNHINGWIGGAYNFTSDIGNEHIVTIDEAVGNFTPSDDFTAMFWTYYLNSSSTHFISRDTWVSVWRGWHVSCGGGGDMEFLIGDGTDSVYNQITDDATDCLAIQKRWTMITVTKNSSHLNIYINGTRMATDSWTLGGSTTIDAEDYLHIGSDIWEQRNINGSIDEVRIFNDALSDAQIKNMYNYEYANRQQFNTLIFNETSIGDEWSCAITPNDLTFDGIEKFSSNLTIVGTPSGDVFVSLTPGILGVNFKPSSYTQKMVEPSEQTSSLGVLNVTNNGTVVSGVVVKIDYVEDGYTLMANTSSSPNLITINTANKNINSSLASSDGFMVWLFMNYSTPTNIYPFDLTFTAVGVS